MRVPRTVVHRKVEEVLDSCHQVVKTSLQTYVLLLLFLVCFLVLNVHLFVQVFIGVAQLDQELNCSKNLPVFFVFNVELPLLLVSTINHRMFVKLKYDDLVKYRYIHLHLPQIIEVPAFSICRKRYVPLSPVSVEIVEGFEVPLVHHGEVSPDLYHLSCRVD